MKGNIFFYHSDLLGKSVFEKRGHIKNPQRELAAAINAVPAR
jgi:hypothetical protein